MTGRTQLTVDEGPSDAWLLEDYEHQHLGQVLNLDKMFTQLRGFLGDAPIAIPGTAAAHLLNVKKKSWSHAEKEKYKSWFVGVSFGVEKISKLGPSAIGLELVFRDNVTNAGHPIHVHSLFPSPEYRVTAGLDIKGRGEVGAMFSAEVKPPGVLASLTAENSGSTSKTAKLDGEGRLKASLGAKGTIAMSAKVFTPTVSAMGIADTRAQWIFHRADRPLTDSDWTTWTGLVLDEAETELNFRARIFVIFNFKVYQFRRYSKWTGLRCALTR